MDKKKFSPLYVGLLKLEYLLALNRATIEIASTDKESLGDLPSVALVQLVEVNSELDKRLNRPLGSSITPELRELDNQRDGILVEIKRDVKASAKSREISKSAPGQILLRFLTPYWSIEKRELNTETSLIAEILERYNNEPTLINSAATLGMTPLWTELGSVNANFESLYYERNAELAAKDDPAGKFKSSAVKCYENFCSLVEQSINLTPSDALNTLFDRMDNLRKTYHAMIPKKK
jgi:hypothetical protein